MLVLLQQNNMVCRFLFYVFWLASKHSSIINVFEDSMETEPLNEFIDTSTHTANTINKVQRTSAIYR